MSSSSSTKEPENLDGVKEIFHDFFSWKPKSISFENVDNTEAKVVVSHPPKEKVVEMYLSTMMNKNFGVHASIIHNQIGSHGTQIKIGVLKQQLEAAEQYVATTFGEKCVSNGFVIIEELAAPSAEIKLHVKTSKVCFVSKNSQGNGEIIPPGVNHETLSSFSFSSLPVSFFMLNSINIGSDIDVTMSESTTSVNQEEISINASKMVDLKSIQDEVYSAHNTALINNDHVCQFWSNGEVTSTSGGCFFGERRVVVYGIAITEKSLLCLPCEYEDLSYALVTHDQGKEFRSKLKALLYPGREDIYEHFHIIVSSLQAAYDGKTKYNLSQNSSFRSSGKKIKVEDTLE